LAITAGHRATQDDHGGWLVPKKELVSTLQVLLQSRQLHVADCLPEADTLVRELANFQVKVTATASDTLEAWREGAHDDLVLAVAIAAWQSEHLRTPNIFAVPPWCTRGRPFRGRGDSYTRPDQAVPSLNSRRQDASVGAVAVDELARWPRGRLVTEGSSGRVGFRATFRACEPPWAGRAHPARGGISATHFPAQNGMHLR
jgi:hypothetical protein